MKNPDLIRLSRPSTRRRQRGVVLVIALIVLVAMTLAAIGMTRSIDTANLVAGNLSFKQSSLSAADKGIEAGYQWVLARAGTTALNNTDLSAGFYSSKPGSEPDWTLSASWTDKVTLNGGAADATGNVISYVIHRMCTEPNTTYNGTGAGGEANLCALSTAAGGSTSGGSASVGSVQFTGNPQVYYRITARSVGPKNTASYVQSMVAITN
ncbi:MAG: pilus assembly PilX family protein [Burkholderiales bacterium]